jgi:hypothetical protein
MRIAVVTKRPEALPLCVNDFTKAHFEISPDPEVVIVVGGDTA